MEESAVGRRNVGRQPSESQLGYLRNRTPETKSNISFQKRATNDSRETGAHEAPVQFPLECL